MIRVALVDDQAMVRAGFRMILETEADITVVGEAGDGREAIDLVARSTPDVVLMDVRMPHMDGIEATQRIVERWPQRHERPWIIAVTANAMLGDRETCLAAGMDDHLGKPVDPAMLFEMLLTWLERRG